MPTPKSSSGLRGLEGRVKNAFEIVGAFPVELHDKIQLSAQLFDADSVGFHTYTGRRFAGSMQQAGTPGGLSKLIVRASAEMVLEQHIISNLSGAGATFSIRFIGPATTDSGYAYNANNTFWLEQCRAAAEDTGIGVANSFDVNSHGVPLAQFSLLPFEMLTVRMPIHMLPHNLGARVNYQADTPNTALSVTWHGYVL